MSLRVEGALRVGRHRLRGDCDVRFEAVTPGEGLGDQDGGRSAAGRRASHQPRHHARPDHLIVHHVVGGELLAEDGERIVPGVTAGLGADLREGLHFGAVFLHMGEPGAAEIAQRKRDAGRVDQRVGERIELLERARPVGVDRAQRAGLHLLEAEREHAIGRAGSDRLARQKQRRRAGRAIVVDVDDRNPGHAEVVDRALSGGGVAVHVSRVGLLDELVADAGVGERAAPRLGAHLMIARARSRLGEGNHPNACDDNPGRHWLLLKLPTRHLMSHGSYMAPTTAVKKDGKDCEHAEAIGRHFAMDAVRGPQARPRREARRRAAHGGQAVPRGGLSPHAAGQDRGAAQHHQAGPLQLFRQQGGDPVRALSPRRRAV